MRSQHLPLLIETGLYDRRTNRKLVDFPAHHYLQSFDIEATAAGAWKGSVVVIDSRQRLMQDVFLRAGGIGSVVLRLRWAWAERGGLPSWTPLFSAAVLNANPEFSADGDRLTLDVCSSAVAVAAFARTDRDALVGMRADQAVAQVARENRWPAIIEETDYNVPPISQDTGTTDLSFLRWLCELVPGERKTSPRRFFVYYWDTTGTMHFHSREFTGGATRKLKNYSYLRGADSEVLNFAPETENIANALRGGAKAVYVGTDSLNNRKLELTSSDTGTGSLPGKVTLLGSDGYTQTVTEAPAARFMIPSSSREDFEQEATAHNLALRNAVVKATMEVVGTHDLTVTDEVDLSYRAFRDAREHPLSGRYWVRGVKHSVGDGWKTTYELQRAGMGFAGENPKQTGAAPASPPGQSVREGAPPTTPTYPKAVSV